MTFPKAAISAAIFVVGAWGAPPASATEFTKVLTDQSAVGFSYRQMGVGMDGRFRKFSARLNFDPARPEAASATVEVELGSVDAGSPDADGELAGKPWFDTRAFPTARFVSRGVKALGGDRYEVAGTLTIKGRSREVLVPATMTVRSGSAVFDGTLPLRRGDFSIGEGAWAKFDIVANEVLVRFRLVATPK